MGQEYRTVAPESEVGGGPMTTACRVNTAAGGEGEALGTNMTGPETGRGGKRTGVVGVGEWWTEGRRESTVSGLEPERGRPAGLCKIRRDTELCRMCSVCAEGELSGREERAVALGEAERDDGGEVGASPGADIGESLDRYPY